MTVYPVDYNSHPITQKPKRVSFQRTLRQETTRKQIVGAMILSIAVFQLLELPGGLISRDMMSIGTVILGLFICGIAAFFNQKGNITIVGILLIVVIDLGCGLMLLTSPMGLDVASLPVFDALLICDLIAVTLLPSVSVFPVALANILFILGDITFQHHTRELTMALSSNMAYDTVMQPVSLQVVVAIVSYILVRTASRAIVQADRADEVTALKQREVDYQQREAEQKRQLEFEIELLTQKLVRAANGEPAMGTNWSQSQMLWRVGNSLNLLFSRLRKARQVEQENRQLREELIRQNERMRYLQAMSQKNKAF